MRIVIGLATIFLLTLPLALYCVFSHTATTTAVEDAPLEHETLPPWLSNSTDGETNNYTSNS